MINPTRSNLSFLIVGVFALMAFVNCGGLSGRETKSSPSNSAPNGGNLGKLDRFVGTWGGYSSKTASISGEIDLQSRYMKVIVKPVAAGMVELEGNVWDAKAIAKYDAGSDRYALSFEAEGFPKVPEFPLTFSEADGFLGSTTFTQDGKEFKAKATIKDERGEPEWNLEVTQGKEKRDLTIRLGKEK